MSKGSKARRGKRISRSKYPRSGSGNEKRSKMHYKEEKYNVALPPTPKQMSYLAYLSWKAGFTSLEKAASSHDFDYSKLTVSSASNLIDLLKGTSNG